MPLRYCLWLSGEPGECSLQANVLAGAQTCPQPLHQPILSARLLTPWALRYDEIQP